jgi:pyruvate/2-oxoglutarate dehydrogenase complex dihydrolipoamide acyltransferase (E2) component
MSERLSAATGDVNGSQSKLTTELRNRPVASMFVICKYGAVIYRVGGAGNSEPCSGQNGGRCFWMKKLTSGIAILCASIFIAACTDQAKINAATEKAESDAQRAQAAATAAQTASQNAMAAGQKADQEAASAQDSVRRANDAVARLEAAFSTSVTK